LNDVLKHLEHGALHNVPSSIVIHSMAEYIHIDQAASVALNIPAGDYHAFEFLDVSGLSAHILGTPSGVNIRCRYDNEIAWHARGHNTGSLGYEFLVPGLHDYGSFLEAIKRPYLSAEQYQKGVDQVKQWANHFQIEKIDRHSDLDPTRKKDPGDGFPWEQFKKDCGL